MLDRRLISDEKDNQDEAEDITGSSDNDTQLGTQRRDYDHIHPNIHDAHQPSQAPRSENYYIQPTTSTAERNVTSDVDPTKKE